MHFFLPGLSNNKMLSPGGSFLDAALACTTGDNGCRGKAVVASSILHHA
jgi:hypothetical protein